MSANNFIFIEEIEPDLFQVVSVDADMGYGDALSDVLVPLRQAIDIGQAYGSEYGLEFYLMAPEKK